MGPTSVISGPAESRPSWGFSNDLTRSSCQGDSLGRPYPSTTKAPGKPKVPVFSRGGRRGGPAGRSGTMIPVLNSKALEPSQQGLEARGAGACLGAEDLRPGGRSVRSSRPATATTSCAQPGPRLDLKSQSSFFCPSLQESQACTPMPESISF